jgi:two-component system, cell cycle response regulator CpdR
MAQTFTVLFVDDDDQVRAPVAEILRRADFRVFVAASAPEAVRVLVREHVDVLFTDVVMPDLNGIELAMHAKQLQPSIHVMFATGYFSRAADAAQLGKVLFKPIRAHQIEEALNDVLAKDQGRDF